LAEEQILASLLFAKLISTIGHSQQMLSAKKQLGTYKQWRTSRGSMFGNFGETNILAAIAKLPEIRSGGMYELEPNAESPHPRPFAPFGADPILVHPQPDG
jgi:hypothetical protein